MGKKAYAEVEALHEDRTMSDEQVRAYARNLIQGIETQQRREFFNTWLNKLNLGRVVARLEEQGKITA